MKKVNKNGGQASENAMARLRPGSSSNPLPNYGQPTSGGKKGGSRKR